MPVAYTTTSGPFRIVLISQSKQSATSAKSIGFKTKRTVVPGAVDLQ